MSDETDKLVDKIIETEKQQALRHFRLHPLTSNIEKPDRKAVRAHAGGLAFRKYWISGTAIALITLTVVFVRYYKKENSRFWIGSQPIEQTLASISKSQREPSLVDMSASSDDRNSSEMAWNIQAVVYRVQVQQYTARDLDAAVFRTLSRVESASDLSTDWNGEDLRGLDQGIQQLTSGNALEYVLARSRR